MIAIIDYGMGNLRSVQKALEKVGAKTLITQNPAEIKSADVEITAQKESLIVRNGRSPEAADVRTQETNRKRIASFVHRTEVPVVQSWPVVVHCSTKNAARKFKRRR